MICLVVALAFGCAKKNALENTTNRSNEPAPVEGVEKVKPAPGTGNVQGKVLYNNAPVENIQVRLCEKFSRFLSGCGGKIYTAKTDKDGDFVIANVEPKEYEGLTVRIFDTDSYVFATTGIAGISAEKYNVVADKTLFVAPTHLFKGDLKIVNPKAGSTVSAQDLELKWEPYPDATYYRTPTSVSRERRSRWRSHWRRGLIAGRLKLTTATTRSCLRHRTISISRLTSHKRHRSHKRHKP
jgi:hypothetical protein